MPDVVVWNPWIAKSQRMPDFGDDEYQRMVCIETGSIETRPTLFPTESWEGDTTFRVE
jgi:glucose-6-phosphate 1-epimerase